MCTIFLKEEEELAKAEEILNSKMIETENDEKLYKELVEEFKSLLNQMKRVIKISDIIEAKLNSALHSVDEIAKIDCLTEIYNRRFFNEFLEKEFSASSGDSLSVLMLDIDRFKRYNDLYGHIEGDKCLQLVADTLKNSVQNPRHIVARYGGEEFIVLLPQTNLEQAVIIAENIRMAVESLQVEHRGSREYGIVTVSIGVATNGNQDLLSAEKLVDNADKVLYRAKENGRNRVAF